MICLINGDEVDANLISYADMNWGQFGNRKVYKLECQIQIDLIPVSFVADFNEFIEDMKADDENFGVDTDFPFHSLGYPDFESFMLNNRQELEFILNGILSTRLIEHLFRQISSPTYVIGGVRQIRIDDEFLFLSLDVVDQRDFN